MSKKAISMKYQAKPHIGRARKETLVSEYKERVDKAKAMVFANYQGLTHLQIEKLKKALRSVEAEFVSTKNTLMLIALKDKNLSDDDKKHFEKPTGTMFIYNDIVSPIKELAKIIKELSLPQIKFGILENKSISSKDVETLATLPSVDQLRAQLVGTMKSPIFGLHRALNWNMTKFVMTLKAIETKKSAS